MTIIQNAHSLQCAGRLMMATKSISGGVSLHKSIWSPWGVIHHTMHYKDWSTSLLDGRQGDKITTCTTLQTLYLHVTYIFVCLYAQMPLTLLPTWNCKTFKLTWHIFKNSLKTHLHKEAVCLSLFSNYVMLLSLRVGCFL